MFVTCQHKTQGGLTADVCSSFAVCLILVKCEWGNFFVKIYKVPITIYVFRITMGVTRKCPISNLAQDIRSQKNGKSPFLMKCL